MTLDLSELFGFSKKTFLLINILIIIQLFKIVHFILEFEFINL